MAAVDIPGATAATYKITTADIGEQISLKVTATNTAGSAVATSALTSPVAPLGGSASGWTRVNLGPGGFISGLSFHSDGTKVCRMDTSGAYKWSNANNRWEMMVTKSNFEGFVGSMPNTAADTGPGYGANPGTYELIIAPNDSNRMYMMWAHNYDGRVWVTSDRGASWTKCTSRAADSVFNANSTNWRGSGRKLAVDPQNRDHVICGGNVGLTISTDGGGTWTTVPAAQVPLATFEARFLVAFDPSSAVVGGKKQGIYAYSHGNGVYRSTNGGTTWTHMTGGYSPTDCMSMIVTPVGNLWIVSRFTFSMWKMTPAGVWSSVTPDPLGTSNNGHEAWHIMQDPMNSNRMACVSEIGCISYSTDQGLTWSGFGPHHVTFDPIMWLNTLNNSAGYNGNYALYGCSLEYDYSDGTLHHGHGLGTCKTTPTWTKGLVEWDDNSIGLEQLCAKRMVKPAGGKVVMAVMDQGMFVCDEVNYPAVKGPTDLFAAAWSCDICPTDALTIGATVNEAPSPLPWDVSGYSRDGGTTWTQFPSKAYNTTNRAGGMIACGSDPNNFVLTLADNGVLNPLYYTTDAGVTWNICNLTAISGIPNPQSGDVGFLQNPWQWRQTICSDKVLANTFYARNNNAGYIRSTDKGATWQLRFALVGGTYTNSRLQAVPGNAGHLFFASGLGPSDLPGNWYDAMKRSKDGGLTWADAHPQVKEVHCIGFGKALAGGYPTIYIAGFVNNVYGLWRSTDDCATWTKFGDYPQGCFDSAIDITGDPNIYGVCYFAMGASGIFKYTP